MSSARTAALVVLVLDAASLVGCFAHRGVASSDSGGLTIVLQEGKRAPEVVYIDHGRMRIENGHEALIIDAEGPRLLSIDMEARTYVESGKEDLQTRRTFNDQMRAKMWADLQRTTKDLSADQREKMMAASGFDKEGAGLELTFDPTGETRSVNGIACEMYRGLVAGRVQEEDCISPWDAGLFRKEDFAGASKLWKECVTTPGPSESVWPLLDLYPGFPIARWRELEAVADLFGTRTPPDEVKTVKRGAIPASIFEAPAGFTKTPVK